MMARKLNVYQPQWMLYPRVTEILGVVSKGKGFEYWLKSHGMTTKDVLLLKPEWTKEESIKWLLDNDKANADDISKEACDIGSEIHKYIDTWHITGIFKFISTGSVENDKIIQRSVENYIKWFLGSGAKIAEVIDPLTGVSIKGSELRVYSDKLGYRGTLDRLITLDGKLIVDDLKNAKRIYPTHVLQTEMYRIALEEMYGIQVEGLRIVRIDKSTGEIEIKKYKPSPDRAKVIKSVITVYNWNKVTKDQAIDTEVIK